MWWIMMVCDSLRDDDVTGKSMLRLEAGVTEPLPGGQLDVYCTIPDRNSKNPLTSGMELNFTE